MHVPIELLMQDSFSNDILGCDFDIMESGGRKKIRMSVGASKGYSLASL